MALFSMDQISSLSNELKELQVDNELIHKITTDLVTNAQAVDDIGFDKMHVADAAFGDSSIGGSLGYHHQLAHQKVSTTLTSVLEDLHTFRTGLATFQKAVDDADTSSADDLKARQDAVTSLGRSAGFAHTHRTNEYYHHDRTQSGSQTDLSATTGASSATPATSPTGGPDA